MREQRSLEYAKNLVVMEVQVPQYGSQDSDEKPKDWRELVGIADQFFASLQTLFKQGLEHWWYGQPSIVFDIVAKGDEIAFFVTVPKEWSSLIERQILSYYPDAQIFQSNRHWIFEGSGKIALAQVKTMKKFVLPIRTYKNLEYEPMNSLTNSLSKLGTSIKADIQIILRPTDNNWQGATINAARSVNSGKNFSPVGASMGQKIVFGAIDAVSSSTKTEKDKADKQTYRLTPIQEDQLKMFQEKGSKPGFETQIKIVVVAPTQEEANMHLGNITGTFAQFNSPERNGFRVSGIKDKSKFLLYFMLKEYWGKKSLLNSEEIASVFHFPNQYVETPKIRWLLAKRAPAPVNVPNEGVVLGENIYRGEIKTIRMANEDRFRHIYLIGGTGTGKTTLFENMILQDIQAGKGVCYIDPHGEAAEAIMGKIPKERAEDVIYFNPGDIERPMGLNLLEWKRPEQRDFLVQEWIQIFYKLFDPNQTGMVGPQFEHWGRNASLTIMANPEGGTLIEIPRLFTDDEFRKKMVSYVKDPVVLAFWNQQLAKTSDFHKSEMYNYFISKFGRFMTNEMMRNCIGQPKSAFDFADVINNKKILIVNISKGRLGEMNTYMLGMIIVAKIYTAIMERVDIPENERSDYFLYVDEFQNMATDTFANILSEARKFRLGLSVTNQYIAQLPENIRDAIIGNVGTMIAYRVGITDAEFLEKLYAPVVNRYDLVNIDKYNAYVKLLIDNTPTKPFSMRINKTPIEYDQKYAETLIQLSRVKYGRDKKEVDSLINERARIDQVDMPAGVEGQKLA